MPKRDLTEIEKGECAKLKAIFDDRKKQLGLSQQSLGDLMDISQGAVGHYLNGRNALNLEAAKRFAKHLKCRIGDFSQRLQKDLEQYAFTLQEHPGDNVEEAPNHYGTRKAPIISSIQAGQFSSAVDIYPVGQGEDYEAVPAGASENSFWMRVKGFSMISSIPGSDSFPPGTLIHVDPERQWEYGDFVVAKLDESEEATFKQIVEDAGRKYLTPLNDSYDKIQINGNCRIVGKVTEYKRKL